MHAIFIQGYHEIDGRDGGDAFTMRLTQLGADHTALWLREPRIEFQEDVTVPVPFEEPYSLLVEQVLRVRMDSWPTRYCRVCGTPLIQGQACPIHVRRRDDPAWLRVQDDFADQVARYKEARRFTQKEES